VTKGAPEARRFAAEELRRRGRLSRDVATSLLDDSSVRIRAIAIEALIDDGAPVTAEQVRKLLESSKPTPTLLGALGEEYVDVLAIRAKLLERQTAEQLESQILWLTGEGPRAYRVLALRDFERLGDRIRRDLTDGGESVQRESIEAARQHFGEGAEQALGGLISEHRDFIKGEYIAAGLAGVAAHGRPEDVALARPYINSKQFDVRDQALRVLERFGTREDLDALVRIAQSGTGGDSRLAARTALRISPGIDGVARTFLASRSSHLIALALQALTDSGLDRVQPVIVPLLESEDATIRVTVLSFLVDRKEQGDLQQFLDEYLGRGYYYYNVVTWLDRVLYAPMPLRAMYRKQLVEEEGYRKGD
jgi:HEAT repeat protein